MKITFKYGQAFIAGFTVLLLPGVSHAQQNLGYIFNHAGAEVFNLATGLSYVAYAIGAALGITSIVGFIHANEGKISWAKPSWQLGGSAFMIAAPYTLTIVLGSMGITGNDHTALNYTPGKGSGLGLDQLMVNLMNNIYQPAKYLIQAICYATGAAFGIIAIKRLAEAGHGHGHAPKAGGTVGYFIAAACLIAMGNMMDIVATTMFASTSNGTFTALAYTVPGLTTMENNVFAALFAFVEVIGWISFGRGLMLLRSISEGNGQKSHGQAFTHLIAGALAVNMAGFINAIQTTLGISLIN